MHSEDDSLGKLNQYLTAHLLQFGFLPIVYMKIACSFGKKVILHFLKNLTSF